MNKLWALLIKEFRLLGRDLHALMVLFAMPAAFILVMSLAMEGLFAQGEGRGIAVFVFDRADTLESKAFAAALSKSEGISVVSAPSLQAALQLAASEGSIALGIEENFSRRLANPDLGPAVILYADAALAVQARLMIRSAVIAHLSASGANSVLRSFGLEAASAERPPLDVHIVGAQQQEVMPTAVQQSVPAWLIFSMFFLVIPIANAFITERRTGTLMRLATFNVTPFQMLLGKLLPYVAVNQVQFFLMLGVGLWVVPLCGGEKLAVAGSWMLLWLVAVFVSFAAIAYGLLIASLAETTDQATTLGGVSNILLAAVGGVMVPVFAMPGWMQTLSAFSPMSWALESFLAVSVRNQGLYETGTALAALSLFALGCFAGAYLLLKRRIKVGYRGE